MKNDSKNLYFDKCSIFCADAVFQDPRAFCTKFGVIIFLNGQIYMILTLKSVQWPIFVQSSVDRKKRRHCVTFAVIDTRCSPILGLTIILESKVAFHRFLLKLLPIFDQIWIFSIIFINIWIFIKIDFYQNLSFYSYLNFDQNRFC